MTDGATGGCEVERDAVAVRAQCPRCAYDLRVHFVTWTDRCPMRGVCPECGYECTMIEAQTAASNSLPWLYEHADHWWDVRKALQTTLRALAPWRFWPRVVECEPVRVRRVFLTPVLTCASAYLAALCVVYVMIGSVYFFRPTLLPPANFAEMSSMAVHHLGYAYEFGTGWVPTSTQAPIAILAAIGFSLGAGATFAAVSMRFTSARRWAIVSRLVVYSLSIAAAMYLLHIVLWTLGYTSWTYACLVRPQRSSQGMRRQIMRPVLLVLRGDYDWVFLLGMLVWQCVYWWHALRSTLRRSDISSLWVVVVLVGALCALVPLALYWPRFTP